MEQRKQYSYLYKTPCFPWASLVILSCLPDGISEAKAGKAAPPLLVLLRVCFQLVSALNSGCNRGSSCCRESGRCVRKYFLNVRAGRQLDMSREQRFIDQVAGNHTSCERQGVLGRQSSNLQTNRKPYILGDKDPRGRQRKVKKGGNLWCFPSLCSHYNIIKLTGKKFPSCISTLTHLIKTG